MSVKTAVIGYGHLGKWHVEKALALSDCHLIAVVEPGLEAQKSCLKKHPEVRVVSHLEEVIDEIDAAIVVTPTSFHFDITKKLLEKKKHVFCEKPMTATFKEAGIVKEMAIKNDVLLQPGHSERFHEIWDKRDVYQPFTEGESFLRFERAAPFKGRAVDVDVVQDLMIHDLDLLLFLFNEKPSSVKAIGHKIRTDHWDFVQAEFSFKSGKMAHVLASREHPFEVRSVFFANKKGSLEIDLFKRVVKKMSACENTPESFSYEGRDHLLEEQKSFYQAILKKGSLAITPEEGESAIHLISKIHESLKTNQTVTITT